jgi:protein-tyrosine phosphatase
MAEGLARREIERRGWRHVRVGSAGVAADAGAPASPEALAVMARRGLDIAAHAAARLTREQVEWADLVLAMGHSHLRVIAALGGEHKMALLGEFAAAEPGAGVAVPDPFGGDEARYDETAAVLADLVSRALDRLAPLVQP